MQHCELLRDTESTEEWMDHLRIKPNECNYKEHDKELKEQFINGIKWQRSYILNIQKTHYKNIK